MATATNSKTNAVPAVLAGHALKSMRESGYDLPFALGEVIDNSLEAGANQIAVVLDESEDSRKRKHIGRIAIVDDGRGMGTDDDGLDILQNYLVLGYSTRYMSETTIGKFGVGAKLGALNFCTQIDVWSRIDGDEPWRHAYFDLDEALQQEQNGELVTIAEPDELPIPEDMEYLLPEGSGSLVLWSKVDRLEEGRHAKNADELITDVRKDLSRIFRNFLHGGIELSVNDESLLPHDPLFLMEGTWADKVLAEHRDSEWRKAVKKAKKEGEPEPPKPEGTHFEGTVFGREKLKIDGHEAELKVTLYPPEVTRQRGMGGDNLAKKLRVADDEGNISFVRLEREIKYGRVAYSFGTEIVDSDRFIGVEIRFSPELDEYFGVRNVKKGVEPHGELRRQMREHLKKLVAEARAERERRWGTVSRARKEHVGEHGDIAKAATKANKTLPKSKVKTTPDQPSKQEALTQLASDIGKTAPKEQQAYVEENLAEDFVVESVDFPGSNFIEVQHVADKVIIRLNARHRFYKEMWQPLRDISMQEPGTVSAAQAQEVARRTREALTLLLITYGKAESMDSDPQERYGDLRNFWGQFLDTMMGKVKDVI